MQAACLGAKPGTLITKYWILQRLYSWMVYGMANAKAKTYNITSPHNDVHAEIWTQAKTPRHHMVIGAFFYFKERGDFWKQG